MPYDPRGAQFDPSGSVQAGQGLVNPITQALGRYLEENKKKDFNRSNFEQLMLSPDARRFFTPEMIAKFPKQNSDQQAGTMSGVLLNVREDIQRRQEERQARFDDARIREMDARSDPNKLLPKSLGPDLPGKFVIPMTGQVVQNQSDVPQGGAPGSAVYDKAGTQIGVWDAHGKITKLPQERRGVDLQEAALAKAMGMSVEDILKLQGGGGQVPPAAPPTPTPAQMSAKDQAAVQWAKANPQDARAAAILKKLGIQ